MRFMVEGMNVTIVFDQQQLDLSRSEEVILKTMNLTGLNQSFESTEDFSLRIERSIATDLGLQMTNLTHQDAVDAAKRYLSNSIAPVIKRQPMDPRRLDEIAMRIKQSHPSIALLEIRLDLEQTKDQQTTIERIRSGKLVAMTTEISGKFPSDPAHWKKTYTERKWNMIETNRARYLNRLNRVMDAGNTILPRQEWRYNIAAGKNFQRMLGKKYGFDMGLDDRILLMSLGQRRRNLDDKKMRQLASIFEIKIAEAISVNEEISQLKIRFNGVKINKSYTKIDISWLPTETNEKLPMCDSLKEASECLDRQRHELRHALMESTGVNCPELRFVPDRSELLLEASFYCYKSCFQMNKLFQAADYGMNYHSVSDTARILGNPIMNAEKLRPWKKASSE
uniref:POLAc domain-containing protein n=1 Tax=Heterorhabditis bacteriophora TaxID=37862 RepID=A0A1I7XJ34_HETBA